MKLKKYLGTALKVGGLLGVLGSTECATVYDGGGRPIGVSDPEVAASGATPNVAKSIVDLLKYEFDYVNYITICGKRDDKNNCLEEDYVIRGHKNYGHMKVCVWGLNLSNVCKAYFTGRPIINIILGNDVYAEMADGTVNGYRMNRSTANILAESLTVLIKSEKNMDRCGEWIIAKTKNYGLYGPVQE